MPGTLPLMFDLARSTGEGPTSSDSSRAVGDSGATALVTYCGAPNDCAPTETCAADGMCHDGDCTVHSCINQFQCAATPQGLACVHGASGACSVDTQCRTTERCIDGACSPLADLCVDRTQCASGELCVAGRCVTSCSSDPECAPGFACRLALGVCDAPLRACAITSDCADPNSVCVAGACVPRCHALGACGQGTGVCVDNGCVPSVKAERQCDTDTSCGEGRVCVRHHCYVSCESPSDAACANLPASPICKAITVGGASRRICGTTQNLGSECDPTEGKGCPAGGNLYRRLLPVSRQRRNRQGARVARTRALLFVATGRTKNPWRLLAPWRFSEILLYSTRRPLAQPTLIVSSKGSSDQ